jgi:hypothetical protein
MLVAKDQEWWVAITVELREAWVDQVIMVRVVAEPLIFVSAVLHWVIAFLLLAAAAVLVVLVKAVAHVVWLVPEVLEVHHLQMVVLAPLEVLMV